MFKTLKNQYQVWKSPLRQHAMADAYRPLMRGFLLPGAAYYSFVTWGHWRDETGEALLLLGGLSLSTAFLYLLFHTMMRSDEHVSLYRLEVVGLAANLLMYFNVIAYMMVHFEQQKLVYFVLMAVVFSTSGITLRATLASVALSIGTLLWFARSTSPEVFQQFAFIGVATSFASIGMATLLRKGISRQVDARLAADKLAMVDSLTGIANRRSIFHRIEELVRLGKPFWFGILDLDRFKSINDIYGHSIGDAVLRECVARMEDLATEDVEFGRIGGDEFGIVVVGERAADFVQRLGDELRGKVGTPFEISDLQLTIGCTVGFAHYPSMGKTARQIYEQADFILYQGKRKGKGRTLIFSTNEDNQMRELQALERALREADLSNEIYLAFQPQMDVIEKRILGFEALARWQSPTLGAVGPDKFIRAAELAGLIQSITKVIFQKGLDALEGWPDEIGISFNLSAQDLADRPFIFALVSQVLSRGLAPGRIELEITETAVMSDIEASRALLEELSGLGFKIALDDFGAGYSSFEYIDQLPLNKVKIDKSFVGKVNTSPVSREIVAGVITLCRNLNLKCVLEGVETASEMLTLSVLRPEIIQGYLFGRPVDLAAANEMIAEDRRRMVSRENYNSCNP